MRAGRGTCRLVVSGAGRAGLLRGAHFVNEAGTMHAERGFRPESGRRRAEHPPAAEEPRAPLRCARAIPAPSRCWWLSEPRTQRTNREDAEKGTSTVILRVLSVPLRV